MRWARSLVWIIAAALLGLPLAGDAAASRWGKSYFPDVQVVTQHGKSVHFYDDLIKDKVFVINFLYTSCRDICPLTASRMSELQERLGDSMGRDIFFYSISIDPENDTPAKLKQYANTFQAGPGWLFLTGRPKDIEAIRYKLGERSRVLSDHRNEILLGNGATGQWARNNVLGDLASLALTVRGMDPKWRHKGKIAGADAKMLEVDFAAKPGQALYTRLCAGCHTVGEGDRVGPDLAGVMARRDRDWLMRFVSNPGKMRTQQDPIAAELVARFPTVRMPALSISSNDTTDLLAYIAYLETQHAKRQRPEDTLLTLTTHTGKKLSQDMIKGQPLAVTFGFTHCPDVCPTTLLDWTNMLTSLGPDGDRLKVLFVSVDHERDTPEALAAYLKSFDPRIVALTGSSGDIAIAARAFDAFYTKVGDPGGVTFDHSTKTYLFGRDGQPAGSVDLNTPEEERRRLISRLLGAE